MHCWPNIGVVLKGFEQLPRNGWDGDVAFHCFCCSNQQLLQPTHLIDDLFQSCQKYQDDKKNQYRWWFQIVV